MTIENFRNVIRLASEVLHTFAVGKFPDETTAKLAELLAALQTKAGSAEFIDALVEFEAAIREYVTTLPVFKKDFNRARDPYKKILRNLRNALIRLRPYCADSAMEQLSVMVGLPWP